MFLVRGHRPTAAYFQSSTTTVVRDVTGGLFHVPVQVLSSILLPFRRQRTREGSAAAVLFGWLNFLAEVGFGWPLPTHPPVTVTLSPPSSSSTTCSVLPIPALASTS
jgi:hypothetical protein